MSSKQQVVRRDAAMAATILGLGLLLLLVGQTLLNQRQMSIVQGHGIDFEHLLGLGVSGVGLAIVAWWILSLGLAFVAVALNRIGRSLGSDAVSKFSPAFMLRLAFAALSLNLMGVDAAMAAAPPGPGWQSTSPTTPPARVGWHAAAGNVEQPHPLVAPPGPANDAEKHDSAELGPGWRPQPPIVEPGLLSRQASRDAGTNHPHGAGVVVRDGDTLWSIAAARLGPLATDVDVALSWPKWYAANRSVIGDDPAALMPGQVLQPPQPG